MNTNKMINIHQILNPQKKWLIRSIKKEDLKILEWGIFYRRFRNLMRLSFNDHLEGRKVYLVLVVKGHIAGQIVIDWRILTDPSKSDGKSRAYLYSLRVFPPYRNRGLGSLTISFCEQFLKDKGFIYGVLACEKRNRRALKLYQKLGYTIFKEEKNPWEFLDDKGVVRKITEPEWVMEKKLS